MKEAVISIKGKQFIIKENEVFAIPFTHEEHPAVDEILMVKDENALKVGFPEVEHANVKLSKVKDVKSPKVIAFKYKRRKDYKKVIGHRTLYTIVKVDAIEV